jgi:hypothetical protein
MFRGSHSLVLLAVWPALADGLLPPLTPQQAAEARKLIAEFKTNPRGPYSRIRWFCNDGSVHPPAGLPCKPLGGGRQHAELGPAARKLAEWNLDVGTIVAALSFEEFFDAKRDHHRLKQLVLERYLAEVDRGWIYRRARTYRGARQAEDEEKAGRKLLVQLLSDSDWVARHYYLVNQAVAVVPHGAADATVQRVRNLAKSVADLDARFQPLRNKIHSAPGPDDLPAVEAYLRERSPQGPPRAQLEELITWLRKQEAGQTLEAQISAFQKRLSGTPVAASLAMLSSALAQKDQPAAFTAGAALSFEIAGVVTGSSDGRRNLDLLDLNALVQEHGFRAGLGTDGTRRERLARLLDVFRYAAGAGLISLRQFEALRREAESLPEALAAEAYFDKIRYLARSPGWCHATVSKEFGPLVRLYEPVEPLGAGLVDHLLRGSVAFALSTRLDPLVTDANHSVGIRHSVFAEPSGRGVVALNPGVAIGRLGILEAGKAASVDPDGIYVIPETLADLKPMAGILTLDSGNALSHAQLLAANLGIPNATVPSSLLPLLRKYQNQEVAFAVTPRGMVILREKGALSPAELKVWVDRPAARARIDLDVRRLNLNERRILALTDLRAEDSGVIVGPKAANLAQLARYFPREVAPALVLPFGVFFQHLDRPLGANIPLRQQVREALAEGDRLPDPRAFMRPRLAEFRKAIQTMPLLPAFEQDLVARLRETFGAEGSYGVFVRSDTNAEDLPEFTGAGLNLTVPNCVGTSAILQAVKDVWASPLTERAYEWRARVLRSQEYVVPSVILMRAVPSDKSGVIATMNLETGAPGDITVNVSEGVSAVVDGGVAESLLLRRDGSVRLLEQARSPYKKVVVPSGGMANRPTSGSDYVLTEDEIRQVRRLVAEVDARYPKVYNEAGRALPWDIEFGFEKGELRLFQIRPLVRSQQDRTLEALSRLETGKPLAAAVRLDEPL